MPFAVAEFRKITAARRVGTAECRAVWMFDEPLQFDTSHPLDEHTFCASVGQLRRCTPTYRPTNVPWRR
jgi:hypothetical protein